MIFFTVIVPRNAITTLWLFQPSMALVFERGSKTVSKLEMEKRSIAVFELKGDACTGDACTGDACTSPWEPFFPWSNDDENDDDDAESPVKKSKKEAKKDPKDKGHHLLGGQGTRKQAYSGKRGSNHQ